MRARFSPLLEIRRLERVADKIIVQGVRKPWRYSQDKLTGMFRANHYSYLQEQDELYRYVAGHLSGRVLDVGCWNGLLYPYLNCSDYVGIDLCKEAIEEARSRYAGEFHVSDWETFQYPGHFDSIYLGGVLFYQSDKKGFVRSWERYQPRRIVVQDLEETRVELDYRLVASKQFQLSVEKPDNIVRRAVYIYDVA